MITRSPIAYWQLAIIAFLVAVCCAVANAEDMSGFTFSDGGIIRGPTSEKRIALEFTGDSYAEGGDTILTALAKHKAKASFFFTGKFLRNPEFKSLIVRIVSEGHYIGPHSDSHPLYCPWTGEKKTLVSKEFFHEDLEKSVAAIERFGVPRAQIKYWVPPYEWYNQQIVDWSQETGLTLINFTPGTRSTADYMEDDAKNFVSSAKILESILKKEHDDANGLNGCLLLMHIGAGPKRTDKMYARLDEMLTILGKKGYQFVRVDELLHKN